MAAEEIADSFQQTRLQERSPRSKISHEAMISVRVRFTREAMRTWHTYETISTWLKQAATHAEALTKVLASDLHQSQVEIDEFWSFVQKKQRSLPG